MARKGTGEMATTRKTKATAAAPKEGTCRCGCGEATTVRYRPGHDARHCSQLRKQFEDGKLTRDQALAAVSHSDKLTAKLGRSLDLAAERIAARESAQKSES